MVTLHERPQGRSANVFINYRREDSAGHAGRVFDALSTHFAGRLFMDVDTLEPGVDFAEAIEQAVGACEVLLVVIGREWLTIEDRAGNRRLDDPRDFVRLEIESALARKIRIIPVLVQDVPMPRVEALPASLARLARRNAIELSDTRWAYDVDRLARTIQEILEENPVSESSPATIPTAVKSLALAAPVVTAKASGSRAWLFSLAALFLVAAIALVSVAWIGRTPGGSGDPSPTQGSARIADLGNGSVASQEPRAVEPVARQEPRVVEPVARVEPPAEPRAAEELRRAKARVSPVVAPPVPTILRVEEGTIPEPHEPAEISTVVAPEGAPAHSPSLQPARATILSPRNGEVVGPDVMVQGIIFGLGDQQAFLGIRQENGAIYPRGELFPNADGQWSIKLRSSKEKTFGILVVASHSEEATQMLRDQRSRDNGLSVLPRGASISSGVVMLKKQGKITGIFRPKRADQTGGESLRR